MEVLARINKICEDAFPIHEGDQYGIPRDCPVKRAYKLQQREAMYKRLCVEFNEHMLKNINGKTPEEAAIIAEKFLLSYGKS